MDDHHHLHHLHHLHQQPQHNPPQPQLQTQTQTPLLQQKSMAVAAVAAAAAADRLPQWSVQETKELLKIRAEFDQTFMETKRNKLLWEVISNKMREKGFHRSPEQCKCKWKNLVTRYKGCETMDPEMARQQFPFYDDMQAIFTSRMQIMMWTEAGEGGTSGTKQKASGQFSSDEEEVYINDQDIASEEPQGDISNPKSLNPRKNIPKKRKSIGGSSVHGRMSSSRSDSSSAGNGVREVLEEFMRQQMRTEREWREAWEAREKERAEREGEWRRRMEELENERAAMERMWWEKEEQRRAREEARSEKRDALINALLTKLTREGSL